MPNTSSKYLLEIACFDLESAVIAQEAGADRIEFCTNYSVGGITPDHDNILKAKELLSIPLHVIIRPSGENFVYSSEEINLMKNDILFCKEHKIDGVAFGVLNSDHTINIRLNKELIELAKPLSVTFHRAIDECVDIEKAMNDVISLGFDRVLTSGGKQTAIEGVTILKYLQAAFHKEIIIMPGGGIRHANIKELIQQTCCNQFHSAALNTNKNKVDVEEIKHLKTFLNSF